MDTNHNPSMQKATEELISSLLASEAFVHYQHAEDRLVDDTQARSLLEQLSKVQAEMRKKQNNGRLSKDEIDSLRALQGQVQSNDVIQGYGQAQQEAVNLLREINDEINQLLGINFATFANHSTC